MKQKQTEHARIHGVSRVTGRDINNAELVAEDSFCGYCGRNRIKGIIISFDGTDDSLDTLFVCEDCQRGTTV